MPSVKPKSFKNVIIFGDTGAGKSSTVNMLIGANVATISDDVIGCTFKTKPYTDLETNLIYHDTVGLSEGSRGTMVSSESLKQLIKLLKTVKDGINLLVFVSEKGKIKKTFEENYKLFVEFICMREVPVILFLTRCDLEANLDDWWASNEEHFDRYGLKFTDVIFGCATKGERMVPMVQSLYQEKYYETKMKLTASIQENSLVVGWKMISLTEWLTIIMKKMWNFVSGIFGGHVFAYLERIKEMFMNLGYDEKSATYRANEIYEGIEACETE